MERGGDGIIVGIRVEMWSGMFGIKFLWSDSLTKWFVCLQISTMKYNDLEVLQWVYLIIADHWRSTSGETFILR